MPCDEVKIYHIDPCPVCGSYYIIKKGGVPPAMSVGGQNVAYEEGNNLNTFFFNSYCNIMFSWKYGECGVCRSSLFYNYMCIQDKYFCTGYSSTRHPVPDTAVPPTSVPDTPIPDHTVPDTQYLIQVLPIVL